jgi:hypothetical protein
VPEEQYPVLDVSDWEIIADETVGAEEKFWLLEPGTSSLWLFKSVTVKQGHVHGEDWAEKAAAQLAVLLGVPCARIELAELRGAPGCIGADLRPPLHELQHGQLLLEEHGTPGYVHGKGKEHPGHSVENIHAALQGILPPPGCEPGFDATAYDVFAGYLLFDAWVANRDRHDNNWAVLRPVMASADPLRLCGSYDHASSLGFNLTDQASLRLVEQQRVMAWCQKGTAWRFEHDPGRPIPTLVEMAAQALRLASSEAQRYWPERLRQVDQDEVAHVLARVPRMSDPARTFAGKVLELNRRRVLDACT